MNKNWHSKAEFLKLSGKLATLQSHSFERGVLPYLRVIWPNIILPPSLKGFDKKGIDLLVWSDAQPYSLVIQCKGFEVDENEMGISQIQQCTKSIKKFKDSKIKALKYILVHNRTKNAVEFTTKVQEELDKLVEEDQIGEAELWDRHKLLNNAFNHLYDLALIAITSKKNIITIEENQSDIKPIKEVPHNISTLVTSPYRLEKEGIIQQYTKDPLLDILEFKEKNLIIIIAEAGYGKTTMALRAFCESNYKVIYVQASRIPSTAAGAKLMFIECFNLDEIYDKYDEENYQLIKGMLRPIVEHVLKDSSRRLVFILDGLDESVYFHRIGGFQQLVNTFNDITIPVILITRTEDWNAKVTDFRTPWGEKAKKAQIPRKRIKLIELKKWDNQTICELALRYTDTLNEALQKENINEFIKLIKLDNFDSIYGDIPRRPLFLKMILDTVADNGIQPQKKATLLFGWLYNKIIRDINNPKTVSQEGRARIVNAFITDDGVFKLVFDYMKTAASMMISEDNGNLILEASLCLDDLLEIKQTNFGEIDPIALFLHSILVPLPNNKPHKSIMIEFSHRVFQEFFLAYHIAENRSSYERFNIPHDVEDLIECIERDLL